ncbi:hypothetical protein RYX36_022427 [Vicia faba]
MASRDAVALTGGPDWEVRLGRLDSLTASQEDSNNIMPSPRANATALITLFKKYNLSVKDLVALSGSHSIGQGRCFSIMFRLYNQSGSGKTDPTIDPHFRAELDKLCPLDVDQNKWFQGQRVDLGVIILKASSKPCLQEQDMLHLSTKLNS